MEVYAIKEDFYIMITKHIVCALIYLLIYSAASATAIGSCLADTRLQDVEASVSKKQASETSEISKKFRIALQNKGYPVLSPEEIKKPEVVDNIKRVKSLFNNKDIIFFSYMTLNRYAIYKGKDRKRARLYCFQFMNNEQAYKTYSILLYFFRASSLGIPLKCHHS